MKIELDLSSVQFVKELHQKVMQKNFLTFGFVAGVVNEFFNEVRRFFVV